MQVMEAWVSVCQATIARYITNLPADLKGKNLLGLIPL